MGGRSKSEALAFYEGQALRRQNEAVRAAKVKRAVANVLDGTCESCEDAARGAGVSVESVRAAVRKARAEGEARVRCAAEEENRR